MLRMFLPTNAFSPKLSDESKQPILKVGNFSSLKSFGTLTCFNCSFVGRGVISISSNDSLIYLAYEILAITKYFYKIILFNALKGVKN